MTTAWPIFTVPFQATMLDDRFSDTRYGLFARLGRPYRSQPPSSCIWGPFGLLR